MSGTVREVTVGDRSFRIEPFNGRKALLAGRMVARITKKVPGLLERDAEFSRVYSDANAVKITRGIALTDGWRDRLSHVTPEEWDAVGGVITIPQAPPFEVRAGALFTEVFDAAEDEVLNLLALCVIPNGDLADAAKNGDVKGPLGEWAAKLLDSGSVGDLLALAGEAADQVREEFAKQTDAVGKLRGLWTRKPEADQETTDSTETSATVTESSPGSSTDSPTPTDGESIESSTEPVGASSSTSGTS